MHTNESGLDPIDQKLLSERVQAREQIDHPRIGDYVLFPTGELERISHDRGDGLQTSPSGAFYLHSHGEASLSCGGSNPLTPRHKLEVASQTLPGSFWFFHHDSAGPGRGVRFQIPCRLYTTAAAYTGFLGPDFQSNEIEALKQQIERR